MHKFKGGPAAATVATAMFGITCGAALAAATAQTHRGATAAFTLTSPDIRSGATIKPEQVYSSAGCTGGNVSPELHWSGAPKGAKSFAVTIYDPDVPSGSGWWHWIVYDIPATAAGLAKGVGDPAKLTKLPAGAKEAVNDFNQVGYSGPCPPAGNKPHHYVVTVYALDTAKLGVPATSHGAMVGYNLHLHTLAKASVTGLYGR